MKRITPEFARALIEFEPGRSRGDRDGRAGGGFGESQLEGAVAAYNMLAENRIAYVADEVGMGKTYVALGVIGMLRHLDPAARIVVLAPRENIQLKWIKELRNFIRNQWKVVDNRLKSIQGTPSRQPTPCHSLADFVHELTIGDQRDLFLRMTSFSLAVSRAEYRRRHRRTIRELLPWLDHRLLSSRKEEEFRDMYGRLLNAIVPEIDLLVVDEAHNLKHGFHEKVSNRNRILGLALGHSAGAHPDCPWYGARVKRALCLSATPFEDDYGDLTRQLDVLGFGDAKLRSGDGRFSFSIRDLADREKGDDEKREIVRSLLVRRVAHLRIAGAQHTKNMYRREWRQGGYTVHDEPMRLQDTRQRLVVGLVQKKVAEVLGDERFGNAFQIGMLSSFESFLETVAGRVRRNAVEAEEENSDEEGDHAVFDGEQTQVEAERRGADTRVLAEMAESHRERFGRGLPHPKLDASAAALAEGFRSGEKALVFVRRVATVAELASKLDRAFDSWLQERMESALPELADEVRGLFARYREETSRGPSAVELEGTDLDAERREEHELLYGVDADKGGTEDFFSWFFRGKGPPGVLSGAAFQKNRLSSVSASYSTLFEDDYVARILGRPAAPLERLADVLAHEPGALVNELRALAWGHFRRRTRRVEGYPRSYVFEAYQAAALFKLDQAGGLAAEEARAVLHERFPEFGGESEEPPPGFPGPEAAIGLTTFFTALDSRPQLRESLWPDAPGLAFRERFRRSEQRRELLSAMVRLGAAYIDVYLLAIREAGTFELGQQRDVDSGPGDLAKAFVDLLDQQRDVPGFHAFRELHGAAEAFDTLLAVNFPEAPTAALGSLSELFGRALQHQAPVGRMSGGVNKRLVRQFRMPGFPLVLVTTDVLQEGEDLHTFCRNVVHYGITWTPSAMEQRTGRIDRIGSLVQRRLDGRADPARPEEKIQVRYPHLADTVEVLQVRRVLHRLDRFMRLVHERVSHQERRGSTIDKDQEILCALPPPVPLEGLLESAFPVRQEWLTGELGPAAIKPIDRENLEASFESFWGRLVVELGVRKPRALDPDRREGVLLFVAGELAPREAEHADPQVRHQLFQLELRSCALGASTLMKCRSDVGLIDLSDQEALDTLYNLQRSLGHARLCARRELRGRSHRLTVEASLLLDPTTSQLAEVVELVRTVTSQADRFEAIVLARDSTM